VILAKKGTVFANGYLNLGFESLTKPGFYHNLEVPQQAQLYFTHQ
jgi:hypothetical protein